MCNLQRVSTEGERVMSRSKKISLGFQVVNTKTGEALCPIFDTRKLAKEIASKLYNELGILTGVRHLEEYIGEDEYKVLKTDRGALRAMIHSLRARVS